jgi:hypothetical protein
MSRRFGYALMKIKLAISEVEADATMTRRRGATTPRNSHVTHIPFSRKAASPEASVDIKVAKAVAGQTIRLFYRSTVKVNLGPSYHRLVGSFYFVTDGAPLLVIS